MKGIAHCLILLVSLVNTATYAVDTPMGFEDAGKQERYQELLKEIRCLVCQNQSLADSHADLAQDLRVQVYNMVDEGQPDQVIVDFLVQRYGEFVLYRPRLNAETILLWFGPFILLVIGMIMVYRTAVSKSAVNIELNEEERSEISGLLDNSGSTDGEKG